MTQYSSQLQSNTNLKLKDFTSLQELPRIFVNVTKAIGMFVDIWLGKIQSFILSIESFFLFLYRKRY